MNTRNSDSLSASGMGPSVGRFAAILLLATALGSTVVGCGSGRNPDAEAAAAVPEDQKLGAFKFEVLPGSQFQVVGGQLRGSGQIRMSAPMVTVNSAHNFYLRFQIADGGELRTQTFARSDLSGGVELVLRRPAGAQDLKVAVIVGAEERDYTAQLPRMAADQVHELWWDVHNDHTDSVHSVLWNQSQGDELLEDLFPAQGVGLNWGVKLQSATLLGMDRQEPRDKHE